MSKFTLVYYYVPEDKDDPEYPNVFGVNLAQEEIRINDIKAAFPLEGEYHFRFKFKMSSQLVWMDLPSKSAGLPLFDGKIFIKATRISWEDKRTKTSYVDDAGRQRPYNDTEEAKMNQSNSDTHKHRAHSQPQHHEPLHNQQQFHSPQLPQAKPNTYSNNDFDLLGTGPTVTVQSKSSHKDLLDDFGSTSTQTKPVQKKGNNLMDFDNADLL
mmetsp:Transcript_79952/g.93426  ORF Transcript_79952/g.93426 Transcript_79952/m.93426 type:complete len:212 (-) Transcript_79952:25-660(-)